MRRHVLPKRHVSPKRHLSPKRHGATTGARLRSRTKTRGRSRKAMRGGMHTGQSSKNSSALPWIAGAVVGTSGLVLGAYMLNQLHQKQADTQASITQLITNLNTLSLTSPELSTTDLSSVLTAVKELQSKLNTTQTDLKTAQETQRLTEAQNIELQAEQQRLTAAAEDAFNRATKILEDARAVEGEEGEENLSQRQALVEFRRQDEEKNAKSAQIQSTCIARTVEYNKSAKMLTARILILTAPNDASNSNDSELQKYIEYLRQIQENLVSNQGLISGLKKLKLVEEELNVAICDGTNKFTFDNFLALMVKIQDTFDEIPKRPQVNIHKYLEDDFKILDEIDFKIVKQLLIEKAQAHNRSENLDDINSQILTGIDSFKGIFKAVNGQMLHRDLLAKLDKFKNSLQTAYRDAQNADRKLTAYNALLQ